jgi:hypothetical protein
VLTVELLTVLVLRAPETAASRRGGARAGRTDVRPSEALEPARP